ncbi:hypothetical protein HMI54_011916 [Coelomomyces lativittatus]|nr:hypothetical protein HMI55_007050 [Coelomomyces lativittatus]KAJ1512709.1 hypothetical protein HMI56_003659 [Coelomomyces lativittatus]KAJ1515653.1 hypothetical protein HMI54_011916 [Coelomomyces lativittatus]
MGIKISFRLALMSIFLCFFIQAPQTAHGQDTMKNGAEGTCGDMSKKSNNVFSGGTDKISETLDNLMDVVIHKFQDVHLSISPAGLYHVLGLLVNMADENSKSYKEIEEGWMVKKKENKPNDLFNFNREMKSLNFNSSVLYYYPRSLGKPSSKLSFVVKESGGLLFQEKGTVNYQISKKTGERLKNYELPENEKSNVILNIVSFSFQWMDEFVSVANGRDFTLKNDKYMAHTIFTTAELPFFRGEKLSAVQLHLKDQAGQRIEGMSVYIVSVKEGEFFMLNWDTAFVSLKKKENTVKKFEMAAFELDAEFEFDTQTFPNLLRPGNTEFQSVAQSVELKFKQKFRSCVDENGSHDADNVAKSDNTKELPLEVHDGLMFLPPFYFIIANDQIGLPYLIHKVVEPLQSNQRC